MEKIIKKKRLKIKKNLKMRGLDGIINDPDRFNNLLITSVFGDDEVNQKALRALLKKPTLQVDEVVIGHSSEFGGELAVFAYCKDQGKKHAAVILSGSNEEPASKTFAYLGILTEESIKRGANPDNLPERYVIIMCNEDPYGHDSTSYRVRALRLEGDKRIELGGDTHIIFYNLEALSSNKSF